jgi:polyhydroxybutyrate depolymerase
MTIMNRTLRFSLFLVGLLVFLVILGGVAFRFQNRTNGTLVSSGERRAYLLYVPETYDPSAPTPLVISIHGFVQWPAHQMQLTHWNDLAEEYGFLVVYPSGSFFPLRWRISGTPGTALDPDLDVTFLSDLIDQIAADYNIDRARVYANGLSNGGGMSFLLSCRLSDRIAAIGMVAGAYVTPWEDCQPARPVPAIVFHGTADPIVPYQGGPVRDFELPSITGWVDMLAQRNGCSGEPLELPAQGQVTGVQFTDCAADVIFYTIAEGGHSWPGGETIPEWIAGTTNMDIDATRMIWEFFQQHPLVPAPARSAGNP